MKKDLFRLSAVERLFNKKCRILDRAHKWRGELWNACMCGRWCWRKKAQFSAICWCKATWRRILRLLLLLLVHAVKVRKWVNTFILLYIKMCAVVCTLLIAPSLSYPHHGSYEMQQGCQANIKWNTSVIKSIPFYLISVFPSHLSYLPAVGITCLNIMTSTGKNFVKPLSRNSLCAQSFFKIVVVNTWETED